MHHAFAQGRDLGAALNARADLEAGRFSTAASGDMEQASLSQFAIGKPFPRRMMKAHLLATCTQFLGEHPRNILLVEHALARSSDPWILKSRIPVTTCEDAVFFYATHEMTVDQVRPCAWTILAAYPPVLAVLGRLQPTASDLGSTISKEIIFELAANAEIV
jgi:hypothetical protein